MPVCFRSDTRDASASLSVVVASMHDPALLRATLRALVPQCAAHHAELLVARAGDPRQLAGIAREHPSVRLIEVAGDGALHSVRAAGLAAAGGGWTALTEDHCVPDDDWVAVMGRHAAGGVDVVGGRMDNAHGARALDWGAFFAEYGSYAAESAQQHDGVLLTAANVGYSRAVLADVVAWMSRGAWENVVHDRLRAAGHRIVFDPSARVVLQRRHTFGAFAAERFRHGRDYARARLVEEPRNRRWQRIVTGPLLPPLLLWRVARGAARSAPRVRAFARALPYMVVFFGAWAIGEIVGYVQGSSGATPHRVTHGIRR